ncbi:hypothetical protein G3T36_04255 [Diaminobutyricibacter tongyongensis]|uniref:Uncharacterized protein n=1 Tax=Leifsonia tongyongensis TaxID=1268043 RepID=A0A6L9XVQ5_9MICO|nr:hypothetical protein [Diaminobutyricibacter tongyongensis]NEN05078.1 hypothetical protein [Diaminobutyricibacter tongyongensis]
MHRVQYAGGSVLTGDAIATALLEYAAALARNATSATVEIPVREADGERGIAQVLIGPASQLVSTHEPDIPDDIVDAELVERFAVATRQLAPATGSALTESESVVPVDDFDTPPY